MPLRTFKCTGCNELFESFSKSPTHCEHAQIISILKAPSTKFMEKTDDYKGKSQIKDQEKILKARARAHSRDVDTQDLIEMNPQEEAVKNGWVKEDGTKRKAIDDI